MFPSTTFSHKDSLLSVRKQTLTAPLSGKLCIIQPDVLDDIDTDQHRQSLVTYDSLRVRQIRQVYLEFLPRGYSHILHRDGQIVCPENRMEFHKGTSPVRL